MTSYSELDERTQPEWKRKKKLKYFSLKSKSSGRDSKGSYTELKSIIDDLWYGSEITGVTSIRSTTQLSTGTDQ